MSRHPRRWAWLLLVSALILCGPAAAQDLTPIPVEGQPLAGNVQRLLEALQFLGAPLNAKTAAALQVPIKARDAALLQKLLDPHLLAVIDISPEARVKVRRGPAAARLQEGGCTPVLLKVLNLSTSTTPLRIASPQAGAVYSGGRAGDKGGKVSKDHFLDVEMFTKQPMTEKLSGLEVEYVIALIYSAESGKREANLKFDIGQGTQDLGFRAEVPVLFDIRPAIRVKLEVRDFDDTPTVARFTFSDSLGRIYPPQAKRLAPDFFFQQQVYRADGGIVLLPPGELTMTYGRGPEYRLLSKKVTIPEKGSHTLAVKVQRWINPMDYGFYNGDHHIHAAGCAHYTSPTEGVFPEDMFLHVKGEGMNVGCNLTWGPCFDFQRQFFEPRPHKLSEPFTVLRYDVEVSGFGSQSLGHVCLLNLRDMDYPGSEGTKTKGWPSWTTPLMRWAKSQGAFTGYAHSANGLTGNPKAASERKLAELDVNKDGEINKGEASKGLLPEAFEKIDANNDGLLTMTELVNSHAQAFKDVLPNYAIPEMNGIGAQEICVTTAQGLCDFISAMDTARVPEWNCWYHIMNCGFPLKASGETDFPCITGNRVGQGRVYVQLGKIERIDYEAWCKGLAEGRSYVSDGYAHALSFTVDGKPTGSKVDLAEPAKVTVKARVAFAADIALGTAVGGSAPQGPTRKVELIVNGQAVAARQVPADDKEHDIAFAIPIEQSSWVALRHFPQMHTNPVNVIVDGKPIRASRKSAEWCAAVIQQLWNARQNVIAPQEREEAQRTFQNAIQTYRKLAEEAPAGS